MATRETLKIRGQTAPPAEFDVAGFAMLARRVIGRDDIPDAPFRVLAALVGLSRAGSRKTDATVAQITAACGKPRRCVDRALAFLVEHKLIDRRPSVRNGKTTVTRILIDPTGFELSVEPHAMWRLVHAIEPRRARRDTAPPAAQYSATSGAPSIGIQLELFEQTPPQPPEGGEGGDCRPRKRRNRKADIIDAYREWANEPPEE